MIKSTEPLWKLIQEYQEVGLDVGPFPTQAGDRYALRLVDPDDPNFGDALIATFSLGGGDAKKRVVEADRPSGKAERKAASDKLNQLLHDPKSCAKFVVCTILIDEDSVANGYAEEKDLNNTFLSIAYSNKVASDSSKDAKEAAAESKRKSVRK